MVVRLVAEPDGWTARFGIRVTAAVDLDHLAGYAGLDPTRRLARTRAEDAAYLARLCAGDPSCTLRVDRRGGALTIGGVLRRPDRGAAARAGEEALERLLAVPEHVLAKEDEGEPDAPAPTFELRRPRLTGVPSRPDAGVRYYLALPPLRSAPSVWAELRGEVAVSVVLRPTFARPDHAAALAAIADQYDRLARPSVLRRGGLYSGSRELPAEPFAARAAALYRSAAERYRGWVFRMTVGATGPRPLVDQLAASVGAVVEAPGTEVDIPPLLRLLRELADPADAVHAVWLPAGRSRAFPVVDPPSGRSDGRGVTITHSEVVVEGDLFGGDKHGG